MNQQEKKRGSTPEREKEKGLSRIFDTYKDQASAICQVKLISENFNLISNYELFQFYFV